MNENAYLTPKEVAEKLEDAKCIKCKASFTEEDFADDRVIIVPELRLAHYDCFFNIEEPSHKVKVKAISLSDILNHPNFSFSPSDYIDQEEEE